MGDFVKMRRVVSAVVMALTLGVVVQPAAEAAAPQPKRLTLSSYTVTVMAPDGPATVCDYNQTHCGYIAVQATFSGLSRVSLPVPGGYEAGLGGSIEVTRVYGCQDARGKRLHRYDFTVSQTEGMNTRRGMPFQFPRTGDTVSATTYAFLTDNQPNNCPAGTTAMIYKITAKQARLDFSSYLPEIPSGTYRAPSRAQWVGAVPTPTAPLVVG